jgi:hypothetical protein
MMLCKDCAYRCRVTQKHLLGYMGDPVEVTSDDAVCACYDRERDE